MNAAVDAIDATPMHHFLVSGQVIYRPVELPESDTSFGILVLNGVIKAPTGTITMTQLNSAQQVLQMNFHKQMGESKCAVVNVVIENMMPLGVMTYAEFNNIQLPT